MTGRPRGTIQSIGLTNEIAQLIFKDGRTFMQLDKASGVSYGFIHAITKRNLRSLVLAEFLLKALGYRLQIVPLESEHCQNGTSPSTNAAGPGHHQGMD